MKRVWSMMLAAVAIATVCSATASTAMAAAPTPAPKVTIVIATGLTWADITPTSTPTLWRLAETGAVGNLNARMRNREDAEPPSALEGALDISAGNWATPSFEAGAAYNVTETVGAISAGETFRRLTGEGVATAAICFTGMPATLAANTDAEAAVVIGTLGQAVRDAGGLTGAIGNSDAIDKLGDPKRQRPAAVAAIDARGLVDAGDVSAGLLRESPDAPYGMQTDLASFERALTFFDAGASAHGGPALLVLDPGDAYRARSNALQASPSVAAAQHAAAVSELDRVVEIAQTHGGQEDTLIVASESPASETAGGIQGFGPILVSGSGLSGYLSSASTHRIGTVTNLDVTATALEAMGITPPVQVVGSAFTSAPAPTAAEQRVAHLRALNSTAVSIDGLRGLVSDAYIKLFLAVLGLGGLLIVFRDRFERRARTIMASTIIAAALLLLTVIPAGWLMFLLGATVTSYTEAAVRLILVSLGLLAAALLVWKSAGVRAAAATLSFSAVVILVVDQFFGAPLSFINFMGYSPLLSARYYGMGNQPSAYLVGAAIVGSALVLDRWSDATWASPLRRFGLPALGVIVVFSAAAPFLGANVGVAIWASAGFIVAWVLMNNRRLTWKTALAAVLIVVLLIGGFAALDVLGQGPKTHLARSLSSAQQGGIGQLWLIVSRKAQTNARILGETQWSQPLYALIAFIAVMALRCRPDLPDALRDNSALRSAIMATAVAGVLAFFTEDSGIVVPAFLVLPLGASLVAVLLERVIAEKSAE
jgi:hypothetical protein